jgi:hypothetical protein
MMIPPTFLLTKTLEASVIAAVPKSVGSYFRYKDAKHAEPELKKNIIKGEALTVAQVSMYSVVIDHLIRATENAASKSAPNSMLKTGLATMTKNRPLFLMGLGFVANYLAETVSRLKYKRDLGPHSHSIKEEIKEVKHKLKGDQDDHQEDHQPDPPDDHKRNGSRFIILRKPQHQSVTFSQNSTFSNRSTTNANPFQISTFPSVTNYAFSV